MTVQEETAIIVAKMRELAYMHTLYRAKDTPTTDMGYAAVNSQICLLIDRAKEIMPPRQAALVLADAMKS